MNIKEAKEEIKNAMTAYFAKDRFGNYKIPSEKQRPVFLMGPPGIGKTAIMEQIANELHVGLCTYSMTHHTRQSALGLPFIVKKEYDGKEVSVSEYTMSEIIASVYDLMEKTGHREGILFLDEVNCVSETLAPAMLEFLQYKVFGKHRVPKGWIVVTAGNPAEYNNSVREFDIVTWDRLKRMDVEPDFGVWKEYAVKKGVHPAVLSFLDNREDCFYKIESTASGKSFVTARGWCDLSDMIKVYEESGIKVTKRLISQYLQNEEIAREFAVYYDLFKKYESDYEIPGILDGSFDDKIKKRAESAPFDERLAFIGLLSSAVFQRLQKQSWDEKSLGKVLDILKRRKGDLENAENSFDGILKEECRNLKDRLEKERMSQSLSQEDEETGLDAVFLIEESLIGKTGSWDEIKKKYNALAENVSKNAEKIGQNLSNAFGFCRDAFGKGQEMLLLVTDLTMNPDFEDFILKYGCEEYESLSDEMMFSERRESLKREIKNLKEEMKA